MIRIFLAKLFDLDASECEWDKKRDLMVELYAGDEQILCTSIYSDVMDEIEINQQCSIDNVDISYLYLVVKQEAVMTREIISKIKIPLPKESCTKLFKLVHYRPIETKSTSLGKVRISFQHIDQANVDDTKIKQFERMIQSFQIQLEKLESMQETLNQLQQDMKNIKDKTREDQFPDFLSVTNIPPVILRSVASAKQLRINQSGSVDALGNYGRLTLFKINRLSNNEIRIQSNSNKKRFLRIDGMNVDGLGGQGILTTFKVHYMGKHIFAFESKQHENHFLASDSNGHCHVVFGDQPEITRFAIIVTGEITV